MTEAPASVDPYAPVPVELRDRRVAALLAWLWPGAGHLYQRRFGKGVLFMVCILTTYFFGLGIGNGHVVYASFKKPDVRYPYFFQVAVGIPALPAMFQPRATPDHQSRQLQEGDGTDWTRWMAPPAEYDEQEHDELAWWHQQTGFFFELGTLYTMVAGLLNVLAIYDAFAGPVFMHPNPKKQATSQ